MTLSRRQIAVEHAFRFLGQPYSWGGDDAVAGFDCSGYAIEILKSVGILPRKGDWTSWQLAKMFRSILDLHTTAQPGDLIFWNRGSKIGHVEVVAYAGVVDDHRQLLTLGASGGTSKTKDTKIPRIADLLQNAKQPITQQILIAVAMILAEHPDAAAIRDNAFIKLRPAVPGWAKIVDPFAGRID